MTCLKSNNLLIDGIHSAVTESTAACSGRSSTSPYPSDERWILHITPPRDLHQGELEKADDLIRQADYLMAEAIRAVAGLYEDGILEKPDIYEFAYPDLLLFHEAATPIEIKLHKMFLEYRMRTFQGSFHANPDYAFWYGWAEMRGTLTEIQAMAEELRQKAP